MNFTSKLDALHAAENMNAADIGVPCVEYCVARLMEALDSARRHQFSEQQHSQKKSNKFSRSGPMIGVGAPR